MAVQGRGLTQEEIGRIVSLLSRTEMTIPEIAERMRCSRSAVVSINRRCRVRAYEGLRSTWQKFERDILPGVAEADETLSPGNSRMRFG